MPAQRQQPELFLGEVIRHSLAPVEDSEYRAERDKIRQAYLAVTFVIEPEIRVGASWLGT